MSQEEQLYTLMAVAEQQQKDIEQAITRLNQTKQQILEISAAQTHKSVSQAVQSGLNEGKQQLTSTVKQMNQVEQRLRHTLDRLSWTYIGIGLGIFFALVLSFLVFLMWFIPSLDEIQQRRADQKNLNEYNAQLSETKDGKKVVKIMTKNCYAEKGSKMFDWCEIDSKRY